ncbi:MAG TPA: nitroreductase/quinone reductase family protein [Candidatus Sulfotelmatobacter sp.]|nr:nitroreductase/quinone reductase family protein [Candidatus Sulfotelmatobacter sp.]
MTDRHDFNGFNQLMIADLRAHGGLTTQGPMAGRRLMVLTTTGARTGTPRSTPLAYTRDGAAYVIIASKGGAPTHPAWYHNLVAHPEVTVEVEGERFQARATVVHGPERRRLYDAQAAEMPGFAEYEARTERVIPVVRLERVG